MVEDRNITIASWPEKPASLEHRFDPNTPCPVSIHFTDTAAQILVATDPKTPLDVNMNMTVSAREAVPICIKLCEPICARSDYTIGLNVFDNAFATITLRGITQIAPCGDEKPYKMHEDEDEDDLTFVEGIGEKVKELLNKKGIRTFKQLASANVEQINAWLIEQGWNQMDPKTWPEQSNLIGKAHASGKKEDWDNFYSMVNWLKGGIEPAEYHVPKAKRKQSGAEKPDISADEMG
jgi:hypothetical protein